MERGSERWRVGLIRNEAANAGEWGGNLGLGRPCFRRGLAVEPEPRAPVAQLDRALASGAKGHRFESCRAHLPKTLAEIAIEAGLVNRAGAARAGRLSAERKQPLVAILIRELGVDEVALIGAVRKQTRIQLIDPAEIQVDPEALRLISRDVCARLRVLPLGVSTDGPNKVLRVAMADPTDTSAVLELEQLTQYEIDIKALPLSAIEELVDKGYRQFSTAVVNRPRPFGDNMFITSKTNRMMIPTDGEAEVSVTAQIPLSMLQAPNDLDARFAVLCQLLIKKGLISEAELTEAMKKLEEPPTPKK